MCCFSQPIHHVSRTRIFARPLDPVRQLLVYSMSLVADADLAMVLPIPVPPSSPENAVRFVDMSSAPTFFEQLDTLFPQVQAGAFGAPRAAALAYAPPPTLVVHEVGDFEASFVPTPSDFARLDPRFRLPPSVWDALPAYKDWGFCVFKLRIGGSSPAAPPRPPRPSAAGLFDRVRGFFAASSPASAAAPPRPPARDFHPMAFGFPRRNPMHLFFPTVHIHDGVVHPTAHFDHTLYCQGASDSFALRSEWDRSSAPAGVLHGNALAWLDREAPAHRRKLLGHYPNRDTYVEAFPAS